MDIAVSKLEKLLALALERRGAAEEAWVAADDGGDREAERDAWEAYQEACLEVENFQETLAVYFT